MQGSHFSYTTDINVGPVKITNGIINKNIKNRQTDINGNLKIAKKKNKNLNAITKRLKSIINYCNV